MALFFECMPQCAQKVFDTADIVREGMLRQLSRCVGIENPVFHQLSQKRVGYSFRHPDTIFVKVVACEERQAPLSLNLHVNDTRIVLKGNF